MEYLIQFYTSITNDPFWAHWMFTITVGFAICLLVLGFAVLLTGAFGPLRRRLQSASGYSSNNVTGTTGMSDSLNPLAPYLLPKKEQELSNIRSKLFHAGFRKENAPLQFYALKLILTLLLATSVFVLAPFFPKFSTLQVVSAAVFLSSVGMIFPNLVLSHLVEKRKRLINNGFPDALDLLVACAESGLGLNAAMQRVAKELSVSYPQLSDELALVNIEIRAGVDRFQALRNLSERTGIEDIRGFVSSLSQSLRFGTSIADTLRVYSEEFRDKRMQRAEEQAAKMGIKMIFPLVLCMFPAFFVVAIGPAILGVLRALKGL